MLGKRAIHYQGWIRSRCKCDILSIGRGSQYYDGHFLHVWTRKTRTLGLSWGKMEVMILAYLFPCDQADGLS